MKYKILYSFLLFLLVACQQETEQNLPKKIEKEPVQLVKTEKIIRSNMAAPIHASGILGIKKQTQLGFKIGGVIAAILVDEGAYVQKGQLLAQLEKAEINAQVAQAKNALLKSERDLNRARNLFADTVATLEQVQDAEIGQSVREANLQIAEFNQKYSSIYAPASGKVLKRLAQPQEIIAPGQPVFVLSIAGDAKVMKVGLVDKDVVKIKNGDAAEIEFDAYPNKKFRAKVVNIPELPDAATATYPVELSIENQGKKLKAGFFGTVKIQPGATADYYKIPISALVETKDGNAVIFVPNENKAEKVNLKTQRLGKDFFTVLATENLKITEVITDGAAYLTDGEKLKKE